VLKDAKHQARRALLTSAGDDLIKAIVDCAINTINENHKIKKREKSKLSKYRNRLRELIDPKVSFKCKPKLLIEKDRFIVPLLTIILLGIIGTQINNSQQMALQRMILFPPELWQNRCQTPPPPVKKILKIKFIVMTNGNNFASIKTHT